MLYEMGLDIVDDEAEPNEWIDAVKTVFGVEVTSGPDFSPSGWPNYTFKGTRDALILLAKVHAHDPDLDAAEEGWLFLADHVLDVDTLQEFRPMVDVGLRDGGSDGKGSPWRLSDLSPGERRAYTAAKLEGST
jgi:hypothetical protein